MPKLKTLSLTFRPPVGADVTLDVQISVDGAGVFWGLVPMEFVEDIRTAIERANIGERSCPSTPRRGHGTSVTPVWRSGWRTKPTDSPFKTYGSDVWLEHSMYWLKNGAHVGSRDLSELEALLKEAGEESVKASTDTKLVLRYCLMTRVSYAKGPDGKLYQSRGAAPGHDAEFKGSLHATNDATSYAIGVGAQFRGREQPPPKKQRSS